MGFETRFDPPQWEKNHWLVRGTLARGVAEDGESGWARIGGIPVMVTVAGVYGADVTVYGSCALAKPGTGTQYPVAGTKLISQPDSIYVDGPYEWVKIVVSNYASGTIEDASFLGRDRYAQN